MDWKERILESVKDAKKSSFEALNFTEEQKNVFLDNLAESIRSKKEEIIQANAGDVKNAIAGNCSDAFIDRLKLTDNRIEKMIRAVEVVKHLPDPVGKKIWETERPNGLHIERVRTPIGVIGIIYESRPDVTIEASILCIKSGNCVILKGGKEAKKSNRALARILKESLKDASLPAGMVNLISAGGRKSVRYLLSMPEYVDLIIPRGGESLIELVVKHSRIPVIKHYKGVCHTYIDREADIEMALKITFNGKVQRPATCNATETLLVHREIAGTFLPGIARLFKKAQVEIRGCPKTRQILVGVKEASEEDWHTEYLDLIIAVKTVESADEAISHINKYGTLHSESIVTENKETAAKFLTKVDAAAVFHNASTRFTDGGEFGLGAEIGISTDKIHARGPMGLEELTTYKYLIYGNGQIRE